MFRGVEPEPVLRHAKLAPVELRRLAAVEHMQQWPLPRGLEGRRHVRRCMQKSRLRMGPRRLLYDRYRLQGQVARRRPLR